MRQVVICLAMAGMICSPCLAHEEMQNAPSNADASKDHLQPFTGKITRNKVRMRLKPSLEAPILKELTHEEMVIVVGETDEFYAVKPPQDTKAYVFRTFVLDNVVEGSHVNVRLEPDTEAPIIGQLNSGDVVKGTISPLNSRWLEIDPPESTKFYICKEYVQNIGDPSLMDVLCKRRDDVNTMLETAIEQSQSELQKPYEAIRLEEAVSTLNKIIAQYSDFPLQGAQAKEQVVLIQDSFLQKKLAYLENKANHLEQQSNLSQTFPEMTAQPPAAVIENETTFPWTSVERAFYEEWLTKHPGLSVEEYYAQQTNDALHLTGIVEPYVRSVRNKPGNFILVSKTSKLPVAYLYSTRVDLNTKSGQEVTIAALPRPNHDFAFPAYFVLSID
jgi:hypothetical protein